MDGIQFEPNLFRDLNQYPADDTASSSPRTRTPGARLAENAKIFALLLASSNKPVGGAEPQVNISQHHSESQQFATQPHSPAKTALKVSFKPASHEAGSSAYMGTNSDPFSPARHMCKETLHLGDRDPHAPGGSTGPPLSPTASSSYLSRKHPRSVDTVEASRPQMHTQSHGLNRHSHLPKPAPPTCSTPLSRFIELYEHDEHARGEDDDTGEHDSVVGHSEESGFSSNFVSSPTSSSMLRLLQMRSPKSTDAVNKSQSGYREGSPQPRKYFTFDTMHTGPASSSGPTDGQDADLDSILHCFALTPSTTLVKNSSATTHDCTSNVELLQHDKSYHGERSASRRQATASVREDFEDEHTDAGSLPPSPLQTMLQPLQAKLDVVLHPAKLSGDSLPPSVSVPPSSLPPVPSSSSSSSSLPPLPPCCSATFAPPASFDLLLQSHTAQHSVAQISSLPNEMTTTSGNVTFQRQLRERLNGCNRLQSSANEKHLTAPGDSAPDDIYKGEDQEPSLESICRWLCEKYCPAAGLVGVDSLLVQVSDVATSLGCAHNKILRIFHVLDVFKLVRQTSVKPSTFQWLARSRVDLMRCLEDIFSQLQADVVAGQGDTRDIFWHGVAALDMCRDAEAREGNVHCLPQHRTLPLSLNWVERSVACHTLVRHLVADTLVGLNSHCHPDKDVSHEHLAYLSSHTKLSCDNLRQQLKDITAVLCGLDVLQKVPVLTHLLRPCSKTGFASTSPECLKSTFRWIFPLDYLTIFYRHEQKNAQTALSTERLSKKQRRTHGVCNSSEKNDEK